MRLYSILAFLVFSFGVAHAQTKVYVPDSAFRAYLSVATFCMNGDSLDVQCAQNMNITSFNLNNGPGIKDLTGIEHFWKLSFFTGSNGEISHIPEMPNLKSLTQIVLYYHPIESLPDLSQNTALTRLDVEGNNLIRLPDLSNNVNLERILASSNQLTAIPNLDKNIKLEHLSVADNQLTQLPDLSKNTELKELHCDHNLLTHLPDLKFNTKLTTLSAPNNVLESLPDLSHNIDLIVLLVFRNNISVIPDLGKNTKLGRLMMGNNPLLGLPDLSALTNISYLSLYNLNLDSLPSLSHMTNLSLLEVGMNNLQSLPSLSANTKLERLSCSYNLLTDLPGLTQNTLLTEVFANNNRLRTLPDFSSISRFARTILLDSNQLDFNSAAELLSANNKLKGYPNHSIVEFSYTPQLPFGDTSTFYFCEGSSYSLSTPAQKHATSYQWYYNGIPIPNATDTFLSLPQVSQGDAGEYRVVSYGDTLKKANFTFGPGIDSFISAPFYVNILVPGTPLTVDAGIDTSVCFGENLVLRGQGEHFYTWLNEQKQEIGHVANLNVTAIEDTWYFLVTADEGKCNEAIDSVFLQVLPLPEVNLGSDTSLATGTPLTLDAGNPGSNYVWSTGETTRTITVSTSGTYWVNVENQNGCFNSDTIQVTFTTGLAENITSPFVNIYPNPFASEFKVELWHYEEQHVQVKLTDLTGREKFNFSGSINPELQFISIHGEHLEAGIYILTLKAGNKISRLKVVKL